MSVLSSIASSQPLPEGDFGGNPIKMFSSVREYIESPDYTPINPSISYGNMDEILDKGPVALYNSYGDSVPYGLSNIQSLYEHDDDWHEGWDFGDNDISPELHKAYDESVLQAHYDCFSLPYIYYIGYSNSENLIWYLNSHLNAGEVAQYFEYWSEPTVEELYKSNRAKIYLDAFENIYETFTSPCFVEIRGRTTPYTHPKMERHIKIEAPFYAIKTPSHIVQVR